MSSRNKICLFVVSSCFCLLMPACQEGSSGSESDGESGSGTTGDDGDDGTSDGESGTGGGSGSGEDTTTTGPPEFEPIYARGISISKVDVSQGTSIPVAVDGQWVGPEERNSRVVEGRNMLIRAFWEYEEGWEPREIEGRLTLGMPDGTTEVASKTVMVDNITFEYDLNRTFHWMLPAEMVLNGLEFQVELYETDLGYEAEPEPDPPPVAPVDGLNYIGVELHPMEIKVVLVPVDYSGGDCQTLAEPTEDQFDKFVEYMYEQNPVQEAIFRVHETPIVFHQEITSLSQLFQPLQQYRVNDGAEPNEYYFALLNPCSGGVDGAGGMAPGLPPATKAAAHNRVAVGIFTPSNDEYGYETCVHEIGHCQGLAHGPCGDADYPDPNYPYPDGNIGVTGFGVVSWKLKHALSTYDYMTYCQPTWPSDWTWTKTYERIQILTSWDYGGRAAGEEEPGQVLVGLLLTDGSERWWTTRGSVEVGQGEGLQVEYSTPDGLLKVGAARTVLRDGTVYVNAPLPVALDDVAGITRIDGGERIHVDLARSGL
jgi:hypothetical protein